MSSFIRSQNYPVMLGNVSKLNRAPLRSRALSALPTAPRMEGMAATYPATLAAPSASPRSSIRLTSTGGCLRLERSFSTTNAAGRPSKEGGSSVVSPSGELIDLTVAPSGPVNNPFLRLVYDPVTGKKAVARGDLAVGTVVNFFERPVLTKPTMHTVCLGEATHVAPTNGAECISHGCGPSTNVRVEVSEDRRAARMIITKPVKNGADLTFDYNTTEWTMSCPFPCACDACKARKTPRRVQGFAALAPAERAEIWHEASAYIKQLANANTTASATPAASSADSGKSHRISSSV